MKNVANSSKVLASVVLVLSLFGLAAVSEAAKRTASKVEKVGVISPTKAKALGLKVTRSGTGSGTKFGIEGVTNSAAVIAKGLSCRYGETTDLELGRGCIVSNSCSRTCCDKWTLKVQCNEDG